MHYFAWHRPQAKEDVDSIIPLYCELIASIETNGGALSPSNASSYWNAAVFFDDAGRVEDALELYRKFAASVTRVELVSHEHALKTLLRARELATLSHTGADPAVSAAIAMTYWQLGNFSEARAALARLRELMQDPKHEDDAEAQGFLREAVELIEGWGEEKN